MQNLKERIEGVIAQATFLEVLVMAGDENIKNAIDGWLKRDFPQLKTFEANSKSLILDLGLNMYAVAIVDHDSWEAYAGHHGKNAIEAIRKINSKALVIAISDDELVLKEMVASGAHVTIKKADFIKNGF